MWTIGPSLRSSSCVGVSVCRFLSVAADNDGHMYDAALVDDLDPVVVGRGVVAHALPEELEIEAPGGRLGAMLAGVGDRSVL